MAFIDNIKPTMTVSASVEKQGIIKAFLEAKAAEGITFENISQLLFFLIQENQSTKGIGKDVPQDLEELKSKAEAFDHLHEKYVPGTKYTDLDDRLFTMNIVDERLRKLLNALPEDDLVSIVREGFQRGQQPANSNILEDIQEFKQSEEYAEIKKFIEDIDFGEEPPSREEGFDRIQKYKVIRDYIKASNPELNDTQIIFVLVDTLYEEITESQKA